MPDEFQYDVFLSHNAKDKLIVRDVAERLRKDGVKVWFDEWESRPGDSIPAKIEEGLERSRVLVVCMSANAFGSDWALLESGTFRFRDPLNKERRFIPLRLDDAPIKGSLGQFHYINWLPPDGDQNYAKLLDELRFLDVKLTAISSSVRRVGSRFRFHIEIEGRNLSNMTLSTGGITINVPTVDDTEKFRMIELKHAVPGGTPAWHIAPGGEVWGFRTDGSFGRKTAKCLFIESSLKLWKQSGIIALSSTIEAPWPRMEFHVRAWGNAPRSLASQGGFGDPDWTRTFSKDQQGIPAYVVSVGYSE